MLHIRAHLSGHVDPVNPLHRGRLAKLSGLVLALAACSSGTPSAPPPPPGGPGGPVPIRTQPASDQIAVRLGVAIDARAASGAPRLIRAIVPRPGSPSAASMTPDQAAHDHLAALAPLWLTDQRPAELTTRAVQPLRNGASLIRLEQRVGDVPIHQGELRVLVHGDGSLAAVAGTLLPGAGRVGFRSTPADAVERALDALYGGQRARPAVTAGQAGADGYTALTVAATPEFIVHHARSRRELLVESDRLVPVHTIEIIADRFDAAGAMEAQARRLLVADDGRVVRDINLVASDAFVYRALAETTGTRIPLDGALANFTPHPVGLPDGSVPGLGPYNLVVQEAFNGPRDPWLPGNATTTSGNNAETFADINPPSGFSPGDIRPEVRAGRTLNFRYDFTAEPLATPNQSKAAAVNVFYIVNWLHDWFYDSGFTEATGNGQVDNFGRGGIAGDPVVVHAQANALGGSRNNATMATPADGLSPIMSMFLWTGVTVPGLVAPTGSPPANTFTNVARNFEVTGEVVRVVDIDGGGATACGPITSAVAGKIAFVRYAFGCGSAFMMDNVKAAGAIGLVAMIDIPGFPAFLLAGSTTANLPAIVIGFADGQALEAALPATATIRMTSTIEHDGDFDNAIVAHEWGHYMHHRLASCQVTGQCTAMSEGWGDFNALLMMSRPGDDRDGTYGTGLYALAGGGLAPFDFVDPGYFGIRRFPYSTNRARNALSFRHIGDDNPLPTDAPINPGPSFNFNSEVHNAGEVWAQMLWEVYNLLIDQHGHAEAHRRMTDYTVVGLLLNPPEATFTEARDAMIAAANAFDSDDMLLIAAAFAGRGAGTCAVGPPNTSFNFVGVVESGTVAAKLATSTATVSDDGASCDRDGYLDPGESGTLRITVANSGVVAAEQVVVRPSSTTLGVTLGRPITIPAIAPLSQIDLAIPIRIAANAPTDTSLDIAITVDGDAGCNTSRLMLEVHERMGVDEVPGIATSDGFETRTLGWTRTGALAEQFWIRAAGAGANHILFNISATFPTDTQVVSPVLQASPTQPLVVSFAHAFDLEAASEFGPFFDGGVIEVSNDGGATWRDVLQVGANPSYPAVINPADPAHPLRGRPGFSGRSPGFPALRPVSLDFGTQFAGQAVQLRFRSGTDFCCVATGWAIDDVTVSGTSAPPFTGFAAEPTRCTAAPREADELDSEIADVRVAQRPSLASFPATTPE